MKSINRADFEMPTRAVQPNISELFRFALIAVNGIKRFFQKDYEIYNLSDHLRRDAGIDEDELERVKARRASLIR